MKIRIILYTSPISNPSMPRFERSSGSRRDSKGRSPRGESRNFEDYARDRKSGGRSSSSSRGGRSFEGSSRGRRDSSRQSGRPGGGRRELNMTKVTCDSCGKECEVPFKPTSNKPVYCSDCFEKKGKSSSGRNSDRSSSKHSEIDLDIINEKLNKIMKALKIE